MGFDQYGLQQILTVGMITGVTSAGLMWYLRKRDHQKSPAEFSLPQEQPTVIPVAAQTDKGPKELCREAESPAVLNADQDIRHYVARRSREWASATKAS